MTNPYSAPTADLSQFSETGTTYMPEMFSMSGRIGRFRYLAYSIVLSFLIGIVFAVAGGVIAMISPMLMPVVFILMIPAIGIMFVLAIRRLNDIGRSGWWSLLLMIPVVNLIPALGLMFYPGDKSANQYGQAPGPNTTGVKILAWIYIVLVVASLIGFIFMFPMYKAAFEQSMAAQSAMEAQGSALPDASE